MTRKEKIHLLKAIKDGRGNINCLGPARNYFFYTIDLEPNKYERNGKIFTRAEYLAFCEKVGKDQYSRSKIITIVCNMSENDPIE